MVTWRGWGRLASGKRSGRDADKQEPDDARYQAQKMEALGRLTGGVAHDFNNLLTVVLGNATALRVGAEASGDVNSARRAEMIERAAERGGRIAGQLLAYSGRQMLRPETISVYRTLSATSELLAQAAGEAVRIRLESEPGLWSCRVDPGQLESAVLNLVLNARDAMPGGGSVSIRCSNHRAGKSELAFANSASGDFVRIEVTDTGCGIPPELLSKVFEPFFTTKPTGQGSGLGLSQVYGFAGQSGGWVDLQSKPGHFTTVTLFLPREGRSMPEPAAPVQTQAPSGQQPTGYHPVGQHQSVLVVEPDPDLRTTTCDTLFRASYRPFAAANGSAALAHVVSDAPIHLMLIEAVLPGGISGIDLARSACQVRPELRVLLTSDRQRDAPSGDKRFEFLMKPYRPNDLVSVVGAVLTRDSFSVETEELLAEAKIHAPATASSRVPPAVSEPEPGPASAGLHSNAIRLGVMPFRTIGANTGSAFSAGLAEEITTAFSRFRTILCIAPASVAALADEPTRHTERWRQLDLDYLIEGSIRKKGDDIRLVVRLVNMRGTGELSWGCRIDSQMPDVLNLQDQVAAQTAAQIVPEVMVWEGQAAASRPQVDPTAYDLMLRAIPAIYRLDEAGFREAGALLEQSLSLDPSSAACHSWLAHWYLFLLGQGWAPDPVQAAERADTMSQQAVILDPEDARGLTVAGHIRAFLHKDAEAGLWLHQRALGLNPNLAQAWCYSGLAYSYMGQHTEALRHIQQAKHLSPHDPHTFFFDNSLSAPLLMSGQYETAAQAGRRARSLHPGLSSTYKFLIAALGHLGSSREAAEVRRALLSLEPGFSVVSALARSPFLRPEDRRCYADGLRLAGIPERAKG